MQLDTYSKSCYMLSRRIQVWFRLSRLFIWTRTSRENNSLALNSAQSSSYSAKRQFSDLTVRWIYKMNIHLKPRFRALFCSSVKYILYVYNAFGKYMEKYNLCVEGSSCVSTLCCLPPCILYIRRSLCQTFLDIIMYTLLILMHF